MFYEIPPMIIKKEWQCGGLRYDLIKLELTELVHQFPGFPNCNPFSKRGGTPCLYSVLGFIVSPVFQTFSFLSSLIHNSSLNCHFMLRPVVGINDVNRSFQLTRFANVNFLVKLKDFTRSLCKFALKLRIKMILKIYLSTLRMPRIRLIFGQDFSKLTFLYGLGGSRILFQPRVAQVLPPQL